MTLPPPPFFWRTKNEKIYKFFWWGNFWLCKIPLLSDSIQKNQIFCCCLKYSYWFSRIAKGVKVFNSWPVATWGRGHFKWSNHFSFFATFLKFKAHLFLIESKSTVFQSLEDLNQHWGDPGLHHHFPHPDILFLGLKSWNSTKTRAVWAILGPTWAGSMAGLYTAPRQTPLLPEEHNTRHGTASRETPVTGLKSLEYGNEFMG